MIALVDYGAGNLTSVRKALRSIGAEFMTPDAPERCATVAGLIVPGVGNFAATQALVGPWRDAIRSAVDGGIPLLGICVGMQWLFEGSEEAPDVPGLGVLPGRVRRLRGNAAERMKIPHVGWNALDIRPSRLLAGLERGSHVYFTHSYAAPDGDGTVARTTHGVTFASVVESDAARGRVFGTQFHPEKSGASGVEMLRRFVQVAREANVRC